ncbi:MAG TPA: ATP-binding protein [Polyangia bacterium]
MTDAERQTNRLQALAESAQLFAEASTDLPRLLGVIARRFSELVGEAANIRLIDGDALVPVATYHPDPEINEFLRMFHDQAPLRLGQGISGQVIATGEPYYEPQLDFERFRQHVAPAFIPIFEKIGISGMIVVRLRARGINLGYLSLFRTSTARPPFTLDDLHLVQDLADRAALAIDNSRLVEGLERRVAERTASLEMANRELEAFAFSVSHDLRAPLRAIDGYSRILEEDHGPQLDANARRMLGVIRARAQRMNHLIEELLRLSRLGYHAVHPITEIDMRDVVETVLAGIRAANPELVIELRLGELPVALGNVELLRQVWTNLLDNAVKYSRRRPVAIVEVAGQRESGELRYTVTDHGAGFDPQYADKLFGVFQRLHTDAEFEGTGVGLALVQRIVSRHGGRVWAEGRPDVGATFGFGLPERGPGRG